MSAAVSAGSDIMARSAGSPGISPITSQTRAETTSRVAAICARRPATRLSTSRPAMPRCQPEAAPVFGFVGLEVSGGGRPAPPSPRASFTAARAACTIRLTSLAMVTSLKPFLTMRFA